MKTRKSIRKLLSIAMTLALILTLAPTFALTASAVEIESGATSGLAVGDTVYFGVYPQRDLGTSQPTGTEGVDWIKADDGKNGGTMHYYAIEPIEWRVLSNSGGELFLLSEKNLDAGKRYNETSTSITWEGSTMRSWLNGFGASENNEGIDYSGAGDSFIDTAFSAREEAAILTSTISSLDNPTYGTTGGNNTSDKVFLLSIQEATDPVLGFVPSMPADSSRVAVNTDYTAHFTATFGAGDPDYWWLRSPGYDDYYAAIIKEDGYIIVNGVSVTLTTTTVRPAFNLDLSSVLFTSAASGAGAKPAAVGSALSAAAAPTGAVKMTVQDASLSLTCTDTTTRTVAAGDSVSIIYSGATTGTNNYVSCVIENSGGDVLYYGKLATAASGTANFTVPTLANGNYTIKLFAEECNGDNYTDFCSTPVSIPMTVNNTTTPPGGNSDDNTIDLEDIIGLPNGTVVTYANWLCEVTHYGGVYTYITYDIYVTGDVSVVGTIADTDGKIVFDIPQGVTVTWNADLISLAKEGDVVVLYGSGVFEVPSGGAIDQQEQGSAIYVENNDPVTVLVSGGKISASGFDSCAIWGDEGSTTIVTSGEVTAVGDGSYAITDNNVFISGGAVSSDGDYSTAIYGENEIKISGGTVTANGVNSTAIHVYEGTASITGGTVTATGTGSNAIEVYDYGAAAYLAGACTGDLYVDDYLGVDYGIIVEVDTLTIPSSRNGTSDGLTIKAGGSSAVWDTTGAVPEIVFTLTDGSVKSIEWGTKTISQPADNTSGSGYTGGGGSTTPTSPVAPQSEEDGNTRDLGDGNRLETPTGQDPVDNDDGSITLPGGGTISAPGSGSDGSGGVTIDVPPGTVIDNDGRISFPPGSGGGTITDSYGNTFNVPEDAVIILDLDTPLGYFISMDNPFSDINDSDWFYDAMMFAYSHGLMAGTSTNPMMFSPKADLTRGMIVTILYRMAGSPGMNSEFGIRNSEFEDVTEGMWYSDAVAWAASVGIVGGYGDGTFGTNDPVTRQDLAVILYRYCLLKGIDVSVGQDTNILSYNDAFDISEYAVSAFQWACGAGIINGKPGGYLDPTGNATRAEVATVLQRFIEKFTL